jgi:dipeptidyl-peptidase 4
MILSISLALLTCAFDQGSAADYQRAAELSGRFKGLLTHHDVRETWLEDGQLVYSVTTGPQAFQLILVDPSLPAGQRKQTVLDQGQVQAMMATEADKSKATQVVRINQEGQELQLLLDDGAGILSYSMQNQELRFVAIEQAPGLSLPAKVDVAPSRDRGGQSAIYFVNQLAHEVEILWVDLSGNQKSYGKIAAGADRWLSTYSGHAFRLREADGKERFHFVAEKQPGIALLSEAKVPSSFNEKKWRADMKDVETFGPKKGTKPKPKYYHKLDRDGGSNRLVSIVQSSPPKQLQPELQQFRYRKPGDELSKLTLFIGTRKDEGADGIAAVDPTLFPTPWSLSQFRWSEDGRKLRFVFNQRGHQLLRLLEVDAATRQVRTLAEETSPTFIDYAAKTYWHVMEERNEALWMSERDGWNHLYLLDLENGGTKRQLTSGNWMVRSVEQVNEAKGVALLKVMGYYPDQDPYHVHFALLDLSGGELTMLTEGDGTHDLSWSPNAEFYIDRYSRVDLAPVHEMRSSSGELICALERGNMTALLQAGWRLPERFACKGRDGETLIWGVAYRPTNFTILNKYPVIESIYAGPHGAFVPKSFAVHRKQNELAELGFTVVQIDGMGTNWRGKKFHDVAWKNLQDAGFPDRKLWIQALAEIDSSMDLDQVGIYGGSAGGQSAMRALIDHHDFYSVAVADCGCHDNRIDKIWWNELWMGWPIDESYSLSSNVDQAHRMQGDLFLVVGEVDRNVDPASTMQVVDALIKANKDFDLLVVPNGGHGIAESTYGTRRRRDYFVRKLLHVEPRWK